MNYRKGHQHDFPGNRPTEGRDGDGKEVSKTQHKRTSIPQNDFITSKVVNL